MCSGYLYKYKPLFCGGCALALAYCKHCVVGAYMSTSGYSIAGCSLALVTLATEVTNELCSAVYTYINTTY